MGNWGVKKLIYYKVFDDNGFIGVGTSADLRKHQKKHNILVFTGGEDAQYIAVSHELFRDKWMKKPTTDLFEWHEATVTAIGKVEYESLKEAWEKEEEISIQEKETDTTEQEIEESPEFEDAEVTVDYIRDVKLKELSLACRNAIIDGFDLEIGEEKMHFSMTSNDQLNLQDASLQIYNGAETVLYHPDGGEFMMFNAEDMLKIVMAANHHKTTHLAYFNALKKWVNNLKRISSIQTVKYGSDIPAKYQSAFLKSILEG